MLENKWKLLKKTFYIENLSNICYHKYACKKQELMKILHKVMNKYL